MTTLKHVCVHVLDLPRSLRFYREALGLTPQRELSMPDRSWELVFLGDLFVFGANAIVRATNKENALF